MSFVRWCELCRAEGIESPVCQFRVTATSTIEMCKRLECCDLMPWNIAKQCAIQKDAPNCNKQVAAPRGCQALQPSTSSVPEAPINSWQLCNTRNTGAAEVVLSSSTKAPAVFACNSTSAVVSSAISERKAIQDKSRTKTNCASNMGQWGKAPTANRATWSALGRRAWNVSVVLAVPGDSTDKEGGIISSSRKDSAGEHSGENNHCEKAATASDSSLENHVTPCVLADTANESTLAGRTSEHSEYVCQVDNATVRLEADEARSLVVSRVPTASLDLGISTSMVVPKVAREKSIKSTHARERQLLSVANGTSPVDPSTALQNQEGVAQTFENYIPSVLKSCSCVFGLSEKNEVGPPGNLSRAGVATPVESPRCCLEEEAANQAFPNNIAIVTTSGISRLPEKGEASLQKHFAVAGKTSFISTCTPAQEEKTVCRTISDHNYVVGDGTLSSELLVCPRERQAGSGIVGNHTIAVGEPASGLMHRGEVVLLQSSVLTSETSSVRPPTVVQEVKAGHQTAAEPASSLCLLPKRNHGGASVSFMGLDGGSSPELHTHPNEQQVNFKTVGSHIPTVEKLVSGCSRAPNRDEVDLWEISDVAGKHPSIRPPTILRQDGATHQTASDHSCVVVEPASHTSWVPDRRGSSAPKCSTTGCDTLSLGPPTCPQEKKAGFEQLGSYTGAVKKSTGAICGLQNGDGAGLQQSPAVASKTTPLYLAAPQEKERKASEFPANSNNSLTKPCSDTQGLQRENDLSGDMVVPSALSSLEPSAGNTYGVVKLANIPGGVPDTDELDLQEKLAVASELSLVDSQKYSHKKLGDSQKKASFTSVIMADCISEESFPVRGMLDLPENSEMDSKTPSVEIRNTQEKSQGGTDNTVGHHSEAGVPRTADQLPTSSSTTETSLLGCDDEDSLIATMQIAETVFKLQSSQRKAGYHNSATTRTNLRVKGEVNLPENFELSSDMPSTKTPQILQTEVGGTKGMASCHGAAGVPCNNDQPPSSSSTSEASLLGSNDKNCLSATMQIAERMSKLRSNQKKAGYHDSATTRTNLRINGKGLSLPENLEMSRDMTPTKTHHTVQMEVGGTKGMVSCQGTAGVPCNTDQLPSSSSTTETSLLGSDDEDPFIATLQIAKNMSKLQSSRRKARYHDLATTKTNLAFKGKVSSQENFEVMSDTPSTETPRTLQMEVGGTKSTISCQGTAGVGCNTDQLPSSSSTSEASLLGSDDKDSPSAIVQNTETMCKLRTNESKAGYHDSAITRTNLRINGKEVSLPENFGVRRNMPSTETRQTLQMEVGGTKGTVSCQGTAGVPCNTDQLPSSSSTSEAIFLGSDDKDSLSATVQSTESNQRKAGYHNSATTRTNLRINGKVSLPENSEVSRDMPSTETPHTLQMEVGDTKGRVSCHSTAGVPCKTDQLPSSSTTSEASLLGSDDEDSFIATMQIAATMSKLQSSQRKAGYCDSPTTRTNLGIKGKVSLPENVEVISDTPSTETPQTLQMEVGGTKGMVSCQGIAGVPCNTDQLPNSSRTPEASLFGSDKDSLSATVQIAETMSKLATGRPCTAPPTIGSSQQIMTPPLTTAVTLAADARGRAEMPAYPGIDTGSGTVAQLTGDPFMHLSNSGETIWEGDPGNIVPTAVAVPLAGILSVAASQAELVSSSADHEPPVMTARTAGDARKAQHIVVASPSMTTVPNESLQPAQSTNTRPGRLKQQQSAGWKADGLSVGATSRLNPRTKLAIIKKLCSESQTEAVGRTPSKTKRACVLQSAKSSESSKQVSSARKVKGKQATVQSRRQAAVQKRQPAVTKTGRKHVSTQWKGRLPSRHPEHMVPDVLHPVLSPLSSELSCTSSKPSNDSSSGLSDNRSGPFLSAKPRSMKSSTGKSSSTSASRKARFMEVIQERIRQATNGANWLPGYHSALASRPLYKDVPVRTSKRKQTVDKGAGDVKEVSVRMSKCKRTVDNDAGDVTVDLDRYIAELSTTEDIEQYDSVLSVLFDSCT